MATKKNNEFVLTVATVNGSGSQSANTIIARTLFRLGLPVGAKNLFPSNIQGLPTWFTIRVHPQGYTSRRPINDILIAMNPASILTDIATVGSEGVLIANDEIKWDRSRIPASTLVLEVPFRTLVDQCTESVKLKRLLTNMIYVGVIADCLGVSKDVLLGVIHDQFREKAAVVDPNLRATEVGYAYSQEMKFRERFPFKVVPIAGGNSGRVLIDGNSAAAMGALFGGCSFLSWYPITPSTSLAESFGQYGDLYRRDPHGRRTFAILQAEDELSAISMVIGAGWAGARAMTATSGPGLSLMAEAAGLSYFAEIPAVIWDVQRAGPSTGLPTRTLQGDILAAAHLSHGDTQHILLIPGGPEECFTFAQVALDLAEELQTLVIVLSDLDLGMNVWIGQEFREPQQTLKRGKVLTAPAPGYGRYRDVDGDGITYRTLPGTAHPLAAYFARGTGHDEQARYSERPEIFEKLLDRLKAKFMTAEKLVPPPVVERDPEARIGLVAYGSTDAAIAEARAQLADRGHPTNYLRLRSYPFTSEVRAFFEQNQTIYVVEQNRDAQMGQLLQAAMPEWATRLKSVLIYNGLPVAADDVVQPILAAEDHKVRGRTPANE